MWSLTRVHSRKRLALVATTFLNSRGGRLRELRLYKWYTRQTSRGLPIHITLIETMYMMALIDYALGVS